MPVNKYHKVLQFLPLTISFATLSDRFSWLVRANARTHEIRIDKIGNSLSTFNNGGHGVNTTRYYDGADPDDIWPVRSAGIDPSSGKELFFDKDGNFTFDFSYDNEAICGNIRPDVEGIFGSSFAWKGFSLTVNFRYQLGADVFNTALYQKVENIRASDMSKNQDKRAFYQRWQTAGDITPFKNIADVILLPCLPALYNGKMHSLWTIRFGL